MLNFNIEYAAKKAAREQIEASPEVQAGKKAKKDKQNAGRAHGPAKGIVEACRRAVKNQKFVKTMDVWIGFPRNSNSPMEVKVGKETFGLFRDGIKRIQVTLRSRQRITERISFPAAVSGLCSSSLHGNGDAAS